MENKLLTAITWLLLIGGLLLMAVWVLAAAVGVRFLVEVGDAVFGGGIYLVGAAIAVHLRGKMTSPQA